MTISPIRLALSVGACAASAVFAWWLQPQLDDKPAAISMLVTAFTVLAAIQITVLVYIGDAVLQRRVATWQGAERQLPVAMRLVDRHLGGFYLFLGALVLVFVSVVAPVGTAWELWSERAFLFIGSLATLASLSLPLKLRRLIEQRMEHKIERLMADEGVPEKRILDFRRPRKRASGE